MSYNMRKDWGTKERCSLMIPSEMLDACRQIAVRQTSEDSAGRRHSPSLSSVVSALLERGLLEIGAEFTAAGDPLCTSTGKLVL